MRLRLIGRAVVWTAAALAFSANSAAARYDYVAAIDTARAGAAHPDVARGRVFEDLNRDGRWQENEPGLVGVIVSNGRDAVRTGADGRYALPTYDNMSVMLSRPGGYRPPLDADGVPQFFYHHKPEGSPSALRFGGLEATGPLPSEINFPLVPDGTGERFSCVVMGDTQPYSNDELGYIRDGVLDSLLGSDLASAECLLLLGDAVGDDLGLLPRLKNTLSVLGLPQHYVHGNHDYDVDAVSDEDSSDTWRRLYGPNYYSFEIGKVFFVVLDNVIYPCTAADAAPDDRSKCGREGAEPTYNGRVSARQMQWLENTLALIPEDRLIVLMHHIPLVSFSDRRAGRHQTDNARAIHDLLAGRPALSLSGHTHTHEYLAAGEWYEGWEERVGVTRLPFDHVVAGAPSGSWFQGDLGFDGTPMAFARDGTPPGYMIIDFAGASYRITYHAANQPADRQMALSFNTPRFRNWFSAAWQGAPPRGADVVPPVSVADLEDVKLFTPGEIREGVWLTANVWNGERNSRVSASIDGGAPTVMTRTQEGDGEPARVGVDYADPFAVQRQMTIGRYAWQSTSGEPRAQGMQLWRGEHYPPVPPQGMSAGHVAATSSHLWRMRMPEGLGEGTHVATVTVVDRHGREWSDRIAFEIRSERPPRYWRSELWPTN
jgi:hypothetical protein